MTEDGFTLTPVDVRNQEFRPAFRGYHTADVEEFRSRVAEELERLIRERHTLDERVNNFREQLKAFREREKAMSEALVAAQQLREQAEEAAAREREHILEEARRDAEKILSDARNHEANLRRDTVAAQRQFVSYLTGFRALLERNMSEVEALEERERSSGMHEAP